MNHVTHVTLPLESSFLSDEYLPSGKAFSATAPDLSVSQRHGRSIGPVTQSLASPLAVPAHNVYGYSTQQSSLQDASSLHPTELLSPPESCSGSGSLSANSAASPFASYPPLPSGYQNHATGAESFSNASTSFPPQPLLWNDRNMSDQRQRMAALPPPSLSPGTSHNAAYQQSSPQGADRYQASVNLGSNYAMSRTAGFPSLSSPTSALPYGSYGASGRHMVSQAFNPPMPSFPNMSTAPASDQLRPTTSGAQEGPPFTGTTVIHHILSQRNQQMTPCIEAKIQKGFFQVDSKWTCYRRNYFTVTCGFQLKPTIYDNQLFLQRYPNHPPEQVIQFAVQISAKTATANNQDSEPRALVQYTPKRDKATEKTPGKVILQPAQVSILSTANQYHGNMGLYASHPTSLAGMAADFNGPNYGAPSHTSPPQSHTFERIQFQKATANNGKRRAQQQYFHIVVELYADVGGGLGADSWVKIATSESQQMVVRGRSPGHYKDNRRDSSASMDPDRGGGGGGGAGGDGPGGGPSLGLFNSNHSRSSNMEWESPHRGSSQMGGGFRHHYKRNWASDPTLTPESPGSRCNDGGYDVGFLTRTDHTSDDDSSIFGPEKYEEDEAAPSTLFRTPPTAVPLFSTRKRGKAFPAGVSKHAITHCRFESLNRSGNCTRHEITHSQPICSLSYA